MRTLEQQLRYNKLELISRRSVKVPNQLQKVASGLNQLSQQVLRWLTADNEPRVWTTVNQTGDTTWHLYDPMTQKRMLVSSEEEARFWLEARYNR